MKRTARNLLIALAIVGCDRVAMAGLPLTPNTTYVANNTPVIKALDLNQIQTYLSGLYSALYSVKALVIDGTGGAGVTPLAGSARVSATVSGFSNSAPFLLSTVPWGQIAKEQVVLGSARCTAVGGVLASCGGTNIKAVTYVGGGIFQVQFNTGGPNAARHVTTVTPENPGPVVVVITSSTLSGSNYTVRIHFYDLAGVDVDTTSFHVLATGG